ncbi:hypothetical protein GCM10009837_69530 [Streptomyces durmitorensis]
MRTICVLTGRAEHRISDPEPALTQLETDLTPSQTSMATGDLLTPQLDAATLYGLACSGGPVSTEVERAIANRPRGPASCQ